MTLGKADRESSSKASKNKKLPYPKKGANLIDKVDRVPPWRPSYFVTTATLQMFKYVFFKGL